MGGNLAGLAIWDAGGYFDPASGELANPVPSDVTGISRIFLREHEPIYVRARLQLQWRDVHRESGTGVHPVTSIS